MNILYHELFGCSATFVKRNTIPKLTGDYQSWKYFNDLFISLVTENPYLLDVAEMHYLKASQKKKLTNSFQITGETFRYCSVGKSTLIFLAMSSNKYQQIHNGKYVSVSGSVYFM